MTNKKYTGKWINEKGICELTENSCEEAMKDDWYQVTMFCEDCNIYKKWRAEMQNGLDDLRGNSFISLPPTLI